MTIKNTIIHLHSDDNVVISCNDLKKNDKIFFDDIEIKLLDDINLGHKISVNNIKNNEKIIKFGVSIGSATKDIKPGEHVHFHNMKSDYINNKGRV